MVMWRKPLWEYADASENHGHSSDGEFKITSVGALSESPEQVIYILGSEGMRTSVLQWRRHMQLRTLYFKKGIIC